MDTSSLDTSVELARPWTPSYSVHSQGSPLLEHEEPVLSREVDNQVLVEGVPEMKCMDSEEFALSTKVGFSEQENVHEVDSVAESAEPLADTDITDVAVVKNVLSDLNEKVDEPERAVKLEASLEASDAPDMNHELGEAPPITELVLDDSTEVSLCR